MRREREGDTERGERPPESGDSDSSLGITRLPPPQNSRETTLAVITEGLLTGTSMLGPRLIFHAGVVQP